ncbi:MAG: POTRA domain-containing protein [Bacteroidia bacterium]
MRKWLFIAFIVVSYNVGFGQKISVVCNEPLPKIKYPKNADNELELKNVEQKVISQLHTKGYLLASIDSTVVENKDATLYLHLGKQISWSYLDVSSLENDALRYANFKQKWYNGKPINAQQFSTLNKKLLRYYENSGFPFTKIFLDSVSIEETTLKASLNVEKFKQIRIDSIVVKSTEKISPFLIENLINIKREEIYNEAKIRQISNKLKESGLFEETEPWKVLFLENQTKLFLFLKHTKSSQFNGIAGVQSDPVTGNISVTGDVDLRLQNVLKRAELINVKWKKFQALSQELTTQMNYPYLLQTPFGADLMLHLYKRDTSFLELEQKAEMQYILNNGNIFKGFVKKYSSQTLSAFLDNSFTGIEVLYYGLGLTTSRLDYRLNPLKGYRLDVNAALGNKRTQTSAENDTEDDDKLLQGVFDNVLSFYIPLAKKTTIKLSNQSRYIMSDSIYSNELFRFGGLKTMRGFDEESLFASFFSINTIELRYLFERNSAFYLFTDWAYFERITVEDRNFSTALGSGLGVSFETGAGIFTINYALGKLDENPFLFRAAKIHFGFVAVF